MATTYFRRFRMEVDLNAVRLPSAMLPAGYEWLAWDDSLLERHAAVKYDSFHAEVDARVFPCLGDPVGCRRLMSEIARQRSFVPAATWLIVCRTDDGPVDCGTVQGLLSSRSLGSVQNVGIVPEHRGLGLGRALVLQALQGFRRSLVRRVFLEVTADNAPAVRLYRSLGFRLVRTMYKAVEAREVHTC